jgi:DNA-binding transcriptional LysR family regulator
MAFEGRAVDVRQLRYFVAVAEAGSVSGAARALRVAQPSVSVAVRNLETEFGADLFIRTSQGVRPTAAGIYLLDAGRRILRDVSTVSDQLHSIAAGRAGRLSLAITPTFGWAHLPAVLRRLAQEAPDVQVLLRDPPPLEIIELLSVGEAELGIVATHDPATLRHRYGRQFHITPLLRLPIVAVLPPTYVDAPEPIDLERLRDEAWVVPMQSRNFPGMAALTEEIWRARGWTPPVVREVSTSQTGLPIISGGLGVALMPDGIGRIADIAVVIRPLRDDIPPLTAMLLRRRGYPIAPAAALFTRLVLEEHASTPAATTIEGEP